MHLGKYFTVVLALAVSGLMAAELALDGDFTQLTPEKKPKNWVFHPWSGFMPFPQITAVEKGDGDKNTVSIRGITGSHGTVLRTAARQPGLSGDTLRISFRAKGKGSGNISLYYYTQKGAWNRTSATLSYPLTENWTPHIFNFVLENGPFGETGKFDVCFGAGKGAELDLSSIQVEQESGKFRGNLPLPKLWTFFGPADKSFVPSEQQLISIPETLDNLKPQSGQLVAGKLDFAPFVGGPGKEKCGWAFAELDSPTECDYTIGAGGDWWMLVYVNGKKVFDTMKDGNIKAPLSIENYVETIRLKKGKNIFAVKLVTGAASSVLMLGGPNDLRSIRKNIRLSKINWIENFDSDKPSCSGAPELITGNPTPGLLSTTGQAVFKTSGSVEIRPPKTLCNLPAEPDQYAATGIRIQNFGREKRSDSSLTIDCSAQGKTFQAVIGHKAGSDLLKIDFRSSGSLLASKTIPYRLLPADFIFAANRNGRYALAINSLVDSSTTCFRGDSPFFKGLDAFDTRLTFQSDSPKTESEIVVDNYLTGQASDESKTSAYPFKVELKKDFDPVKEGWKLVFSDEFNGKELDLTKWYHAYDSRKDFSSIRDGKLVIKADWNPQKTAIQSSSIYTYQDFLYGYFEARVRFRKESGWWSAFWLCTQSPSNPFFDGFEIDIFEDYYLRAKNPGEKPGDTLDHNLHIFAGGGLKSWNYHSTLPGSIEDFYVIGCKWTPFEISYYMNGKLMGGTANHSPYSSVTFDPFNHGTGTTPLKAILSGCCGKSGGPAKDGKFPEEFLIDYVRIYEMPVKNGPEVAMKVQGPEEFMVPVGSTLRFKADVKSKAPVSAVYLFDSGFPLECKTKPPYEFEVNLTKEYYDTTNYVKAGRSGKKIEFGPTLHVFTIFAQDADGNVAYAKPVTKFVTPTGKSAPYQGVFTPIPGKLMLSHYDEGGQGVAYYDTTPENYTDKTKTFRKGEAVDASETTIGNIASWEWMRYSVDVRKTGIYRAVLHYGTPLPQKDGFLLLVDGIPSGKFPLVPHKDHGFGIDSESVLPNLKLTEGKHVLTLIALGNSINITFIDFKQE